MTVNTQPDYHIHASSPAPAPDTFSEEPFLPDYESRRTAFFEHILKNPAPDNTKAAWHELARLAAGERGLMNRQRMGIKLDENEKI